LSSPFYDNRFSPFSSGLSTKSSYIVFTGILGVLLGTDLPLQVIKLFKCS
jgi:hypothetical protein